MVKLDGQDRGSSSGPGVSGKAGFSDENAKMLCPPSEPPVPDAATKRLKTLGTLAIQASSLLAKRQASAMREWLLSCKQRRRLRLRPPR